jgi:Cysteinyl-tRNA synthetase
MEDLEKRGYEGKDIRYFLLSSHYRKPLNFSFGALDTARNTVNRLNGFIQRVIHSRPGEGWGEVDQFIYDLRQGFAGAMDDDFNISSAIASIFEFVKNVNSPLAIDQLNRKERTDILDVIKEIDSVLGIMNFEEEELPNEVRRLLNEREKLRRAGNWEKADRIREKLSEMGFVLMDTPEGTRWMVKS